MSCVAILFRHMNEINTLQWLSLMAIQYNLMGWLANFLQFNLHDVPAYVWNSKFHELINMTWDGPESFSSFVSFSCTLGHWLAKKGKKRAKEGHNLTMGQAKKLALCFLCRFIRIETENNKCVSRIVVRKKC